MFFWGSYSFQTPASSAEVPEKPSLRYPMYVPPPPSLLPSPSLYPSQDEKKSKEKGSGMRTCGTTLECLQDHRLKVHLVSSGVKHIIATVSVVPQANCDAVSPTMANSTTKEEENSFFCSGAQSPDNAVPLSDTKSPAEIRSPHRRACSGDESENERRRHPFNNGAAGMVKLVGMGNNNAGQLGPHIPSYCTTLVPLRLEERLQHLLSEASYLPIPASSSSSLQIDEHSKGGVDTHSSSPSSPSHLVQPFHFFVSIACGYHHSLFVTAQGDVYACGENSNGQLGVGETATNGRYGRNVKGASMGGGEASWAGTITAKTMPVRPHGGSSAGALPSHSTCIYEFTLLPFNVPVRRVFANGNVSFALDSRGRLFSWGDPQYGQLGHGDIGEKIDVQTLKTVTVPVSRPLLVEWFSSRHLQITEVAVGKQHMVCSSAEGEVYSVGMNTFGKLGLGDVEMRLLPCRVSFPSRQPEKLISLACGDDHTIVLRVNPSVGSTVYFFGKLSNGDGQLTPVVVSFPHHSISPSSPYAPLLHFPSSIDLSSVHLTRVFAGRGTQCAAINEDGVLWVWGKHSNVHSVTNGTPAWASGRQIPNVVASLLPFHVDGLTIGSCMIVAYAGKKREMAPQGPETVKIIKVEKKDEGAENTADPPLGKKMEMETSALEGSGMKNEIARSDSENLLQGGNSMAPPPPTSFFRGWDIAIPHDDRVGLATGRGGKGSPRGDATEQYEAGVKAFLEQYLEGIEEEELEEEAKHKSPKQVLEQGSNHSRRTLSQAYIQQLPIAPALSPAPRRAVFDHLPTHKISLGDKIRVWMTDVYALGTVQEVMTKTPIHSTPLPISPSSSLQNGDHPHISPSSTTDAPSSPQPSIFPPGPLNDELKTISPGVRVRVEWLRDDWHDEVISLYSDDETLASENQNRWQPFWFEKKKDEDDENKFSYTTGGL